MYIHPLKIGNIELKNNIFLAPMAGITDLPFRIIAQKQNIGLVYTEMISSKAIWHHDQKTQQLLPSEEEPRPVAIQIFGSDIPSMVFAAQYVEPYADIIDMNMGCPAPKVVKNGDGSKLLLNLELATEIVKNIVQAVSKPVSVKIRTGWDDANIVAVEAAQKFEKAGAQCITVHGRTRQQYYSGTCDLETIKKVKQAVHIPVIGNGDIKNISSAKKMFDETGVDGIMIGRAALGNPWIFQSIQDGLRQCDLINQTKTDSSHPIHLSHKGLLAEYQPSLEERKQTILEHLHLAIQEKGEYVAIREMRKHISAYTKHLPHSSAFRVTLNQIESEEELIHQLTNYFDKLSQE